MCALRRQHRAEPRETVTACSLGGGAAVVGSQMQALSTTCLGSQRCADGWGQEWEPAGLPQFAAPFSLFTSVTWTCLPCLPAAAGPRAAWGSQLAVLAGLPSLCSLLGPEVLISLSLISPMCHRKLQQTYPPKPFFGGETVIHERGPLFLPDHWPGSDISVLNLHPEREGQMQGHLDRCLSYSEDDGQVLCIL